MRATYNAIIIDDEPTARAILENHLQKIDVIEVVASCKNAMEAFSAINSKSVNLVFLDINMPEVSGLSFAKAIDQTIKVIFTTAYREYAVDGFDLQAVDYLLKPISLERLIKAVNKFLGEQIPVQKMDAVELNASKPDFFFVRSDRKMVKVNFSDIRYIESLTDYIKIHTQNKRILTRETISGVEAKLSKQFFLRCHRSFIVSIARIDSFTNEYIELGDKTIPISRSYRKEVLRNLESD